MGVSKVFLLYVTKALPEPNCRSMGSRKNQGAGLIHQAVRGQAPMSQDRLSQLGVGLPHTGYTFCKIYLPESTSSGWALQNIIISHFYIVGKKFFLMRKILRGLTNVREQLVQWPSLQTCWPDSDCSLGPEEAGPGMYINAWHTFQHLFNFGKKKLFNSDIWHALI